ncbi:MAG: hypothetical protein Q9226_006165 [Calogaya cf. arnoldii]
MDPFSVTVGVAGLLALTAKTIQATRSFCHEARHAKELANELLGELGVLQFNLSQLGNLLRRDTAATFTSTSVLTTSTHACRNKLTMLHDKIDKAATHPLHRFRWPLISDEHRKTIQELRAFAQWIQFALTIDDSSLLAKTSTEVIDVVANPICRNRAPSLKITGLDNLSSDPSEKDRFNFRNAAHILGGGWTADQVDEVLKSLDYDPDGLQYLRRWWHYEASWSAGTPAPERHRLAERQYIDRLREWAIAKMTAKGIQNLPNKAIEVFCVSLRKGRSRRTIAYGLESMYIRKEYPKTGVIDEGDVEAMHAYFLITENDEYDEWMAMDMEGRDFQKSWKKWKKYYAPPPPPGF